MSTECKRRKHAHTQSSCDTTSEQLWEQVWEARPDMEAPPPTAVFKCPVQLWWNDSSGEEILCHIMQDNTCNVTFDDLPSIWPLQQIDANTNPSETLFANTAKLRCGHTFHPTALALHFVNMDMRCPVCREGNKASLNVECLPIDIRSSIISKKEQLHAPELRSSDDIRQVMTALELHIHLRGPSNPQTVNTNSSVTSLRSVLHSRILCASEQIEQIQQQEAIGHQTNTDLINFPVHRSFQRIARSVLERHAEMLGNTIVFVLHHPLVPITIQSAEMPARQVISELFNCLTMQGTPLECHGSVPLFCTAAGAEPVAVVNSKYTLDNSTPSVTIDVNMHIILNIATYVSEVIGSIARATMDGEFMGPQMLVPEIITII